MSRRWTKMCGLLCLGAMLGVTCAAPDALAAVKKTPVAQEAVKKDSSVLLVPVDRGVPVNLAAPATTVFIANPDVADIQVVSPTSIVVFGKRTGKTTLVATDAAGRNLVNKTITVEQDLTDLRAALDAVIPGHKIKLESVPNGIVMTGEARDSGVVEDARRLAVRYVPKDGGEIINRIKIKGSNQVQIRVRFAEVSRGVDKRFGINWETIGTMGGFAFGMASGNTVVSQGANLLNRNRPNVGNSVNDVTSFSYKGGKWDVNGMIDALAQDGFVTVLAEPNLTAMSGETASFLAGGEFPVPVPQGLNMITIMFRQYGVSLAFTPTIVGEDRISLHVKPEVSQLSSEGAVTLNSVTVPGLTTRRAETTVELASGQSFAIAGLLNHNQSQSVDKYPFLGDVPVLGQLFRSSRFQNNQSELVIIITPYVVHPVMDEQLALPTDGYSPPSDVDRLIKLRQSSSDPSARTLSGTPQAVMVGPADEITGESLPLPHAAPLVPVTAVPQPAKPEVSGAAPSVPVPQALPAAPPTSLTSGPVGPSGSLLE